LESSLAQSRRVGLRAPDQESGTQNVSAKRYREQKPSEAEL
jgi:hypothetical protein